MTMYKHKEMRTIYLFTAIWRVSSANLIHFFYILPLLTSIGSYCFKGETFINPLPVGASQMRLICCFLSSTNMQWYEFLMKINGKKSHFNWKGLTIINGCCGFTNCVVSLSLNDRMRIPSPILLQLRQTLSVPNISQSYSLNKLKVFRIGEFHSKVLKCTFYNHHTIGSTKGGIDGRTLTQNTLFDDFLYFQHIFFD